MISEVREVRIAWKQRSSAETRLKTRVFKLLHRSSHTSMCNNVFRAAAGHNYFIARHWIIIIMGTVHTNDTVADCMFYSEVLHGSSCK